MSICIWIHKSVIFFNGIDSISNNAVSPRRHRMWHRCSRLCCACPRERTRPSGTVSGASDLLQEAEESVSADQVEGLRQSMNAMYRGCCCSRHFSCSWQSEKIMSTVDCSALRPHCDSGYTREARLCRRARTTRAKILPTMLRREMSRLLLQSLRSPLVTMFASRISCGTWPFYQHRPSSSWRSCSRTGLPLFTTPRSLPAERQSIAVLRFSIVGRVSNSSMTARSGRGVQGAGRHHVPGCVQLEVVLHPSFELLALVKDDFSSLGFQWRSLGCGGASGCLDALIHASSVPFCCGYLDLVTQVQPVVVMAAASSLLGLASCSSESVARAGHGAMGQGFCLWASRAFLLASVTGCISSQWASNKSALRRPFFPQTVKAEE